MITRLGRILICLILFALAKTPAYAESSLGFNVYGGVGSSGFDTSGTLSLRPDPERKPWNASVDFNELHSTVGTESRTRQVIAGVDHSLDDNWEVLTNLTYWRDSINDIKYVGPTLGFTYSWLYSDESDKAGDEILRCTLTNDFFFYGTEVTSNSTTIKLPHRTVIVPPRQGAEHTNQLHPNLNVEVPLFDQHVTPYATAGHYFYYGTDPSVLESLAGRPLFSGASGRLNGLVGGFLNNNGDIGVETSLPWNFSSTFHLGADQIQTDNTWSTVQGVSLSRYFGQHLRARVEWTRTIQTGNSSDLFDGGLTFYF